MSQILDEKLKNLPKNELELWSLRHTAEHVLHQAVKELYPSIHLAMGPATDDGFYFDFDSSPEGKAKVDISEKDFPKIEKRMQEIIDRDMPLIRKELGVGEARKLFRDNPYKLEWLDDIEKRGEKVTVYWTGKPESKGSMVDLCSGPHVESTVKVRAFKLLSMAGAYWHGDENNKMLTRIYGTAFPTQKELDEYLENVEEAKKRDHRKIGKEMDLFTFSEYVGGGLPLYTPKGTLVRHLLNQLIEDEQVKLGYQQVWTPQIGKAELFKISGHYDKYKEDMFRVLSNYSKEEFYLKPMNCPQATQIYASRSRSYRDLPLRYSDFAMLYRDEKPGELTGLSRVRSFSTDDCHIFCREDQVDKEVDKALTMTKKIMKIFDFDYRYRLSTRDPEKRGEYLGDPKTWDKVEKWAEKIMKRNKIKHYDGPGEAAFYAPKMDLMATDALGREWQLSTVQIDYIQPARFGLEYVDSDGSKKTPIMIHRAILGSSERFMSIIIEHFAGAFPAWLSPVQIKILPITDRNMPYAKKLAKYFSDNSLRIEIDEGSETLGNKIRKAQNEKVPYMLIAGDKEESSNKVSVRLRNGEDLGRMSLTEFTDRVKANVESKSLNL